MLTNVSIRVGDDVVLTFLVDAESAKFRNGQGEIGPVKLNSGYTELQVLFEGDSQSFVVGDVTDDDHLDDEDDVPFQEEFNEGIEPVKADTTVVPSEVTQEGFGQLNL